MSNNHYEDSQSFKLIVIVDEQENCEILYEVEQECTYKDFIDHLGKIYNSDLLKNKLFQDQQCTRTVNVSQTVSKGTRIYLKMTSQQYETETQKAMDTSKKEEHQQAKINSDNQEKQQKDLQKEEIQAMKVKETKNTCEIMESISGRLESKPLSQKNFPQNKISSAQIQIVQPQHVQRLQVYPNLSQQPQQPQQNQFQQPSQLNQSRKLPPIQNQVQPEVSQDINPSKQNINPLPTTNFEASGISSMQLGNNGSVPVVPAEKNCCQLI